MFPTGDIEMYGCSPLPRWTETLANVTLHNYNVIRPVKYKVTGLELINRDVPHTSPQVSVAPAPPHSLTLHTPYYDWLKLKIVGVSIQIYSG